MKKTGLHLHYLNFTLLLKNKINALAVLHKRF